MYVTRVPNRGSPPAVSAAGKLPRGRQGENPHSGQSVPLARAKVEALSQVLKGLPPRVDLAEAFQITRSLPHGHVAAVLGTAARLEIAELIDPVRRATATSCWPCSPLK